MLVLDGQLVDERLILVVRIQLILHLLQHDLYTHLQLLLQHIGPIFKFDVFDLEFLERLLQLCNFLLFEQVI